MDGERLSFAFKRNNLEYVNRWIDQWSNIDDGILILCSECTNIKLIKYLFDRKKQRIKINNYNTGVRGAAGTGNLKCLKLLIKYGANNFDAAVINASCNGHLKIVKFLKKYTSNFELGFKYSCRYNISQSIKYLIKLTKKYDGGFHKLFINQNFELMQYLIEKSAKGKIKPVLIYSMTDKFGEHPLKIMKIKICKIILLKDLRSELNSYVRYYPRTP